MRTDDFEFVDDDYAVISLATETARKLLRRWDVKPLQIIGLGNALYALERLPAVTPGVSCRFGVCQRSGNEEFGEMRYINFFIDESSLEVSQGGSVYDSAIGGDSFSGPGYYLEIGGYRSCQCNLYSLENHLSVMIQEAQISVNDESNIDYEYEEE